MDIEKYKIGQYTNLGNILLNDFYVFSKIIKGKYSPFVTDALLTNDARELLPLFDNTPQHHGFIARLTPYLSDLYNKGLVVYSNDVCAHEKCSSCGGSFSADGYSFIVDKDTSYTVCKSCAYDSYKLKKAGSMLTLEEYKRNYLGDNTAPKILLQIYGVI